MSKPTGSDPIDKPLYRPLEGRPPLRYPGAAHEPLGALTKKNWWLYAIHLGYLRVETNPILLEYSRVLHPSSKC